jgi:hypothetical protein
MAYLERIGARGAEVTALPAMAVPNSPSDDFSPLEWSVIHLARVDRLWTIRRVGPLRRLWNRLIGRGNPRLANDRLEALRQMAVLSWHFGFTVPGEDVADFLSAGFTPDQYERLVSSVGRAKQQRAAVTSKEAFA